MFRDNRPLERLVLHMADMADGEPLDWGILTGNGFSISDGRKALLASYDKGRIGANVQRVPRARGRKIVTVYGLTEEGRARLEELDSALGQGLS